MTTQLTTPVGRISTQASIDNWELVVARNANLSVNLAGSYVIVEVTFRDAQGAIVERKRYNPTGDALPANVKTAIANLQTALIGYARSAGVLPAGTDTPDF